MDLQDARVGGLRGARDGHKDTWSAVPWWSHRGPDQGFSLPESPLWILHMEISPMTLGAKECEVQVISVKFYKNVTRTSAVLCVTMSLCREESTAENPCRPHILNTPYLVANGPWISENLNKIVLRMKHLEHLPEAPGNRHQQRNAKGPAAF